MSSPVEIFDWSDIEAVLGDRSARQITVRDLTGVAVQDAQIATSVYLGLRNRSAGT